jgi:DNA-binding CsgD family transcriptional regulator
MLLSYAALAEAMILAFMGGIALALDSRSRLNHAYSLLAFASALWAFAYTGVYVAREDARLWAWYRLSAVGWCSTIPAMLLVTAIFTNRLEKSATRVLLAVTIAYAVALLVVQLGSTLFVQGFEATPLGNAEIVDLRKPGYILVLGPMLAAAGWTIAAYARAIPRQSSRRRRRLSALMLACVTITIPISIGANLVLSFVLRRPIPSMGIFALIFLLGGALPIVIRFRAIRPSVLRGLVADVIEDEVVILGPDELGRRDGAGSELLRSRFADPGRVAAAVSEAMARRGPVELRADVLEDGRERRAEVRVTPIFKDDEQGGCIIVIKANRDFSELADDFGLSPQERELVARILEGLSSKEIADRMGLSPGTVRNYTSNIFRKTGARGRSDLIRLFVPGL